MVVHKKIAKLNSANIKPPALARWLVLKENHKTKQSTYSEYTPEKRMKMGRYGTDNGPSKVTKHFSLLLDGKLICRFNML